MEKKRVLVSGQTYAKDNRKYVDAIAEKYQTEIIYNPNPGAMKEEQLIAAINENQAKGLLVYSSSDEVTEKVLTSCPTLKVISRHGVGLENIDQEAAARCGIAIYNTKNSHDYEAVADWVFAAMFDLSRNLRFYDQELKEGRWTRCQSTNLWGKTLGITGYGRIGKTVARRAAAFHMRVMVLHPHSGNEAGAPDYIEFASLDEILREADFLSLHSIVTSSTRGMIGKKQLDAMKPTAFLINSGRAALVDQEALVEALKNHTIGGAAVDVFTNEPATGDPLMDPARTNVLVTPHVGIYTEETLREIDILAMENLVSHL